MIISAFLIVHANVQYRYFTSIFVSLGVFLFGYDQGVMSGIITYVFLTRGWNLAYYLDEIKKEMDRS